MAYLNLLPSLKTTRSTSINTAIGASGLLSIYSGTQPTDPSVTPPGTLLAQLTCSSTFGSVSAGVLTANSVTAANAGATGTAGWARLSTSAGPTTGGVVDMDVGTSGTTAIINTTSITSGLQISCSSIVLTEA